MYISLPINVVKAKILSKNGETNYGQKLLTCGEQCIFNNDCFVVNVCYACYGPSGTRCLGRNSLCQVALVFVKLLQ